MSKPIKDRGTLKNPRREGTGVSAENPLGLKYIYRIEADWRPPPRETIGWRVKFPDCHTLGSRSRSWYDHWEGGKSSALEKAIAWRDSMMKSYDIPMTARRLPVPWVRQSPTGVRGVYRHKSRQIYVSFIAEDKDKYTRVNFSFGRNKMSEREALVAAVQHRVAQERRLYGRVISKLPAWLKKAVAAAPPLTTLPSRKASAAARKAALAAAAAERLEISKNGKHPVKKAKAAPARKAKPATKTSARKAAPAKKSSTKKRVVAKAPASRKASAKKATAKRR